MFDYLHQPKGFYRRVFTLALPVALQNTITASLGFMDTFMVGLLGIGFFAAGGAAASSAWLRRQAAYTYRCWSTCCRFGACRSPCSRSQLWRWTRRRSSFAS